MPDVPLPVDFFSPRALVAQVDRRRPAREVADYFGMPTAALSAAIRHLRRDDPDFPIRRRRLRGVVYVEPTRPRRIELVRRAIEITP